MPLIPYTSPHLKWIDASFVMPPRLYRLIQLSTSTGTLHCNNFIKMDLPLPCPTIPNALGRCLPHHHAPARCIRRPRLFGRLPRPVTARMLEPAILSTNQTHYATQRSTLTYAAAGPIRAGLLQAGFSIGETTPVGRPRGGTQATLDASPFFQPILENELQSHDTSIHICSGHIVKLRDRGTTYSRVQSIKINFYSF